MSENTQETEQASTDVSQETSTNLEATPAQETNESSETNNQPTQETTVTESWEYNGDRKSVPKEFQNYVKGIDRYWSKKSQALAELGQKAKEYEDFKASEDFKAFQESKNKGTASAPLKEALISQDEIDAIALGDGKTLETVIDRAVTKRLETSVTPLAVKQRELEAAEMIKSFSDLHPDFHELLESPAGEFMIEAARRGTDIEEIYKTAKAAEDYFLQKADSKRKADIEAKRNGSVAGKPIAGTPDIVYAENENQAKRLAFELSLKGDKRQVHVKRK